MIIKQDFNHKIIIHASGEYQIRLLAILFASINQNYNSSYHVNNLGRWDKSFDKLDNIFNTLFKNFKTNNLKPNLLYVPALNSMDFSGGTIYTKNRLEKYYLTKMIGNVTSDFFLQKVASKIELANYRLINMKELLDLYGKYLFKDNNHKKEFINKYSMLSDCNIYKTIKNINI